MIARRIPAFFVALAVVFSVPVTGFGQTAPNNPPPSNQGGSGSSPVYRTVEFGRLLETMIVLGEALDEDTAPEPEPPPKPVDTAPPPPEYRDVPPPPVRPAIFAGRPILVDAAHDPDSIVLVFLPEPGVSLDRLINTELKERFGLTLIGQRRLELNGTVVARFRLPEGASVAGMLARLKGTPGLMSAQPQYLFMGAQGDAPPMDMRVLQYAPRKLNALAARASGDGAGVVIGLIDTGIDIDQPAFAHAAIAQFDILDGVPVVNRDHGTALAGLMLASDALDGIAPGARLLSIRAFDSDEGGGALSGSYEIAAAIDLAVSQGARLINLSFAGPRDPLVMSMLDGAAEQGVIIVAAAGNGGPDAAPAYPGAHRDAIAVTATDSGDALFAGANRGFYVAVAAPGVDVLSPMPEAAFELLSGTSIAAAHVSAVVALMLERNPGLTRDEIVDALTRSARDLGAPGPDAEFGAGLADAAAAVAAVEN